MKTCAACDNPLGPTARWVTVYPNAYATVPDTVGYCSESCEETAEGYGYWASECCAVCEREIARHDDQYDLRDARAPQFVSDASGNPVCRRCAGMVPEAPMPPWE